MRKTLLAAAAVAALAAPLRAQQGGALNHLKDSSSVDSVNVASVKGVPVVDERVAKLVILFKERAGLYVGSKHGDAYVYKATIDEGYWDPYIIQGKEYAYQSLNAVGEAKLSLHNMETKLVVMVKYAAAAKTDYEQTRNTIEMNGVLPGSDYTHGDLESKKDTMSERALEVEKTELMLAAWKQTLQEMGVSDPKPVLGVDYKLASVD